MGPNEYDNKHLSKSEQSYQIAGIFHSPYGYVNQLQLFLEFDNDKQSFLYSVLLINETPTFYKLLRTFAKLVKNCHHQTIIRAGERERERMSKLCIEKLSVHSESEKDRG